MSPEQQLPAFETYMGILLPYNTTDDPKARSLKAELTVYSLEEVLRRKIRSGQISHAAWVIQQQPDEVTRDQRKAQLVQAYVGRARVNRRKALNYEEYGSSSEDYIALLRSEADDDMRIAREIRLDAPVRSLASEPIASAAPPPGGLRFGAILKLFG